MISYFVVSVTKVLLKAECKKQALHMSLAEIIAELLTARLYEKNKSNSSLSVVGGSAYVRLTRQYALLLTKIVPLCLFLCFSLRPRPRLLAILCEWLKKSRPLGNSTPVMIREFRYTRLQSDD